MFCQKGQPGSRENILSRFLYQADSGGRCFYYPGAVFTIYYQVLHEVSGWQSSVNADFIADYLEIPGGYLLLRRYGKKIVFDPTTAP